MKHFWRGIIALAAASIFAGSGPARGEESPGIVSHVKVLSDHVDDVSSLDAWKHSFIKDGMDDQQKALAIYKSVVSYCHHTMPPHEFLDSDGPGDVNDPIKDFNVYGYALCCCESAFMEALGRQAGFEARGWAITGHSVPEFKINGHWSLLDSSLITYFKQPDGAIAGVEEINKSITDWLAQHPEVEQNRKAYYKFMHGGGWRNGAPVLAGGVSFDENGWLPAGGHGWGDVIIEYGNAKKNFLFEYASAVGYEVNIQLRPGERLVRNWSNKGLHVNQLEGDKCPILDESPQNPKCDLHYALQYGDLTNGRIGNGTLEYDLPLANNVFRGGMLEADNLAAKSEDNAGSAVHVKDAAQPGVLIFRMPSSYVYLSGELTYTAVVGSGGSIVVSFSDNNGLDWKEISNVTASGPQTVDLKPLVYRRYDYRLKFELKGRGAGLDALKVTHDIQHSQRPLPILDKGDNHIAFSEGPQEGTITIEGNVSKDDGSGKGEKNLLLSSFHPVLEGVTPEELALKGSDGTVTLPIKTPGNMTRLRIGAAYRARDAKDGWTIQVSFDEGKTFTDIGKLEGPHKGMSKYFVFDKIPAGVRLAWVRLAGNQQAATLMFDLRIDADYTEPHGGLAPVKITYVYDENGIEKTDVHVAKNADEIYIIRCDEKPVMKSITLQWAEP